MRWHKYLGCTEEGLPACFACFHSPNPVPDPLEAATGQQGYQEADSAGEGGGPHSSTAVSDDRPLVQFRYALLEAAADGWDAKHLLRKGQQSQVFRLEVEDWEDEEGRAAAGAAGAAGVAGRAALRPVVATKLTGSLGQEYAERLRNHGQLKRLQHPNLVPLIGYSVEPGRGAILVYDSVPTVGNLHKRFFDYREEKLKPLDWLARVRMALEAARGLAFLHAHGVLHCRFTMTCVVLDEQWRARVSDYGVGVAGPDGVIRSRQVPPKRLRRLPSKCPPVFLLGTGGDGYMDPLYAATGEVTQKTDVFSFGIMLLELISGRCAKGTPPLAGSGSGFFSACLGGRRSRRKKKKKERESRENENKKKEIAPETSGTKTYPGEEGGGGGGGGGGAAQGPGGQGKVQGAESEARQMHARKAEAEAEEDEDGEPLAIWARPLLLQRRPDLSRLVDATLSPGEFDIKSAYKVADAVKACLEDRPGDRPSMSALVGELEAALELGKTGGDPEVNAEGQIVGEFEAEFGPPNVPTKEYLDGLREEEEEG